MIVSFFRYGRLGNRLFSFSNLIAFSEVYKVPILMPSFADYGALFPISSAIDTAHMGLLTERFQASWESL